MPSFVDSVSRYLLSMCGCTSREATCRSGARECPMVSLWPHVRLKGITLGIWHACEI